MPELDNTDKKLLTLVQKEFPLEPRPYAALGKRLGIEEEEVLQRTRRLKDEKLLRQVSAIFDTRSLGYLSSLVAVSVSPDRVDEAARIISEHPGVSHNYKRNNAFNIWYTIAVPPTSSLEATVQRLHELSGAETTRLMPTLHLFKIGVNLDMTGEESLVARGTPQYSQERREAAQQVPVTDEEIAIIREVQEDLDIVPAPFQPMAERLGYTEEELLRKVNELQGIGHLRRFAAILYHRRAGYAANGMGVWNVQPDKAIEIGKQMATFNTVSHCYLRPTYPDWPYSVFTMIHGHKVKDCEEIAKAISETTGIEEYLMLYSTKEYKKIRVRYFTEELEEWEEKYLNEVTV